MCILAPYQKTNFFKKAVKQLPIKHVIVFTQDSRDSHREKIPICI